MTQVSLTLSNLRKIIITSVANKNNSVISIQVEDTTIRIGGSHDTMLHLLENMKNVHNWAIATPGIPLEATLER